MEESRVENTLQDQSNELCSKIGYGSVKEVERQLTKKEAVKLLLNAKISDIKYLSEDQLTISNYS